MVCVWWNISTGCHEADVCAMLCVVLYGCETWSLNIKEITQAQDIRERGVNKDTWAWKEVGHKLQNDEIHDMCSSPHIKRVIECRCMRRSRNVARWGGRRMHVGFWYGNVKERNQFEDLGLYRIHLAQDRDRWRAVVDTLMKSRVPPNAHTCSG
jgi:hypothetical protein